MYRLSAIRVAVAALQYLWTRIIERIRRCPAWPSLQSHPWL